MKLKFFFRVIYSFLILKPIFTRQDNTNAFQWRIRNMVYPLENYIVELDEENKSMTFAGNIPIGSMVRLMKGNIDKLIEASSEAAMKIVQQPDSNIRLALLVSCVGRRIVLGDRVEEELEVVKEIFGPQTILSGFYSYGEIAPTIEQVACELHNQTMTITTFAEN